MSSQKKRTYLSVLIVGAVALLIDRFVSSTGSTTPRPAAAAGFTLPPPSGAAAFAIPELPFPKGVVSLGQHVELRDLFLPPMFRAAGPDEGDSADQQAGFAGNPRRNPSGDRRWDALSTARFVREHRLDAVLIDEGLRIAIVNGLWLRVGQSLDGCTLKDITGNAVTFECDDEVAALKIGDRESLWGG